MIPYILCIRALPIPPWNYKLATIKIYAKPSFIYRYRPLGKDTERELKAITNGYIYCPLHSAMNDPMEGIHRMSDRFIHSSGSPSRRGEIDAALSTMGIASFSEVYDHEPMWAHYASQFTGMCVQYSLNKLLKGLDDDIAIARMMYSEIEPVLLLDKSTAVDRARFCLSSKTIRWASEREWRLFKNTSGQATYIDKAAVSKVYLGSRVSKEDEDNVRNTLKQMSHKVAVSKMEFDAYSISFKASKK